MKPWTVIWAAGAALGADAELLERIRDKMEENLARVPNYTCVQTVERARRASPRQRFRVLDRLRFEVAVVGGKEMYSWPGARQFEENSPAQLARGGTTTTGDYVTHAQTVFVSGAPEFSGGSEELLDGKPALRYDFYVSRAVTSYRIEAGKHAALVPYRGSFWADPRTLELVRLRIEADEIPPELEVRRAVTRIDYGRVRVGTSEFLLPQRVEFALRRASGGEDRNRTEFTACRQYVGEAEIAFSEIEEPRSDDPTRPLEVELPPDLAAETRLSAPIDSDTAAIGDAIEARLAHELKRNGRVLAPKGALLRGRLRRLAAAEPTAYVLLELEFARLEWKGAGAAWTARLGSAGPLIGAGPGGLAVPQPQRTGLALLFIRGRRVRLPAGFRLMWVTEPARTARSSPQ